MEQISQSTESNIPEHTRNALLKVLEYLWNDEARHYAQEDADDRAGHIFEDLMTVAAWLGEHP